MNTETIFKTLNDELKKRRLSRDLIICGGAALIALKIITRDTKDVDVLTPKIDADLKEAAEAVRIQLGLAEGWFNNGPAMLVKELPDDWESNCVQIFKGSNLNVKSRTDDIKDLVAIKPSQEEIEEARTQVLKRDASEIWPRIVDECVAELKKRLRYEK